MSGIGKYIDLDSIYSSYMNNIYSRPVLMAILIALLLPFAIMILGFILNYIGEALAMVFSLFIDPWLVYATINYLFFPGVMLHELSHAAFAVITGAKVTEVALFKREGKSLGHVNFQNRGNTIMRTLQYIFVSSAPMFGGALVIFLCKLGIDHIPSNMLWLKIFLGYIGVAMFFHMTMSPQDIKVYVKGIPLFICIVFVVTLVLRLTVFG
ncbi:MAG: hypothetical protein K6G11_05195 [Lachnospiraceae bacterium]|nr:hypothetical protein [Lachnospiraceae bacterium]